MSDGRHTVDYKSKIDCVLYFYQHEMWIAICVDYGIKTKDFPAKKASKSQRRG